jgi:hypothetical protein
LKRLEACRGARGLTGGGSLLIFSFFPASFFTKRLVIPISLSVDPSVEAKKQHEACGWNGRSKQIADEAVSGKECQGANSIKCRRYSS